MKKFFVFIFLMYLLHDVSTQSLLNVYKKGVVKLTPDTEYAQGNNWDKVFESYNDKVMEIPMSDRKSLIMMPNGSVVVSHPYRNFYSMFDANGKFVKEFGITDNSGKRFQKIKPIAGIINNNFYTELDNMGKMVCFDFNGNYVKTLKLNYSTNSMIPMSNNKIAVVGWVIWKDRFRDFVAIVDYETNEQKIIWEKFTNRSETGTQNQLFSYSYTYDNGGIISLTTMPYTNSVGLSSPPQIAFVNNQLIVALPHTGEILAYDLNGKLVSKENIGWGKTSLSVEEQKEIQRKAIEDFSNKKALWVPESVSKAEVEKAFKTIVKQMEADLGKINTPITVPVFSNVIKDSDGNLLFFEIPEKEGANKFHVWVYQNSGKFVCECSFECTDYDLSITPSKMVFHKGYIYALQTLKKSSGIPLRLVRFKVE